MVEIEEAVEEFKREPHWIDTIDETYPPRLLGPLKERLRAENML